MPQRITLRIRDPVSFTGRDALVRIESGIEQKLERLDRIVPHRDTEQTTVIPANVIRELAFRKTRAGIVSHRSQQPYGRRHRRVLILERSRLP
jgi:hypothetical protein